MTRLALSLQHITVEYRRRSGLFGADRVNRAVDNVSFDIPEGECFGLVGESGSGKSTTARAALGLEPLAAGIVELEGTEIAKASRKVQRQLRERAQLVFQDPYSSLDPLMTIGESLAEPLRIHRQMTRAERTSRVEQALESVRLDPHYANRYPQEFSGGQRQRICIARAMILDPAIVVLDEPVSALDVSTQGQILNLLVDLQRERGTTYLLISHDLSIVRNMAHRTAVMYLGQIVETGPSERVFSSPGHPYTAALLSAILEPNYQLQRQRKRILLQGDIPNSWSPPPGCRFHTRCPFAMDICRNVVPEPIAIKGGGEAACHLHDHGPRLHGGSVLQLQVPEKSRRIRQKQQVDNSSV
jgi:oligopeptide/dipeptide ABC transporter ATP-binding protein